MYEKCNFKAYVSISPQIKIEQSYGLVFIILKPLRRLTEEMVDEPKCPGIAN